MNRAGRIIPLQPAVNESGAGFADTGGVCAEAEPFALMVRGNSMEPEFCDGHIIMIDPGMSPSDGSYIIAESEDGHIFRQLRIIDGRKYLVPLNELYPTQELGRDSTITGVITQRCGRRRQERKYY